MVLKVLEWIFFGLIPKANATPEEQLMWRQLVAGLLVIALANGIVNSAYSFGYIGVGFASQSSAQQLVINDLREQIARTTIRWCMARKANNVEAFKFAQAELERLGEEYKRATDGQFYSPTCMELLIDG